MKQKIVDIIRPGMAPEKTNLKAMKIIMLFNQRIVDALKKTATHDLTTFVNEIFIEL